MHEGPLVSIVIPTYDRVALLEKALASACAQTYTNLEIIVCDDAGPHDVEGLIRSIGDPRIRYRRSAINTAKAGAFADGLRAATGTYVMELDDDDFLGPQCVATLVAPLERRPDLVVSFGDHWVVGPDGAVDDARTRGSTEKWGRATLATGEHRPFIALALETQAVCLNVCGLVRRSALDLDDFPADVQGLSDYWTAYLAARDGGGAWYCGERLSYYREHPDNITHSRNDARFVSASFVYERLLADPRLASISNHIAWRLFENETAYAVWLLREGRPDEARAHAMRASAVPGRRWRPTPRALIALSVLPGGGPATKALRRVAILGRGLRARGMSESASLRLRRSR